MAYPRSLSKEEIYEKYEEIGLDSEKIDFFTDLFKAASNVYGIITLDDLWAVYVVMRRNMVLPFVRKSEMLAFSDVARMDTLPYYVYEISELYESEEDKKGLRHLVNREIMTHVFGDRALFASFEEKIRENGLDFAAPMDLLKYADDDYELEKLADLTAYLGDLKSTAKDVPSGEGKRPNPYLGKKLDEFIHVDVYTEALMKRFEEMDENSEPSSEELFLLHNALRCVYREEGGYNTEAEKITKLFLWLEKIGTDPDQILELIINELTEAGVKIGQKDKQTLTIALFNGFMEIRSWAYNGYCDRELSGGML